EATKFNFLNNIGVFDNAQQALASISKKAPDILFSDIEMPGITGIEMMKQIIGQVPAPVFITSHPEYALQSFDLEIFDYLLKPINSERFSKCINRLEEFFVLHQKAMAIDNREEGNDYMIIKQGYDKFKVNFDEILYLEAMKDYTKICTAEKQNYLVVETLGGLLQQLPSDRFQRIHRSYIVNIGRITHFSTNKFWVGTHGLP